MIGARRIIAQLALWLGSAAIAVFFAMLLLDSVFVDGEYIPFGPDSFYHALRILDAAIGERGFYEFDERLQVPEGAWIPWPWGYDYLIAKVVQLAVYLNPSIDALAFTLHVPVAWLLVNTALFLAATTSLGLGLGLRAAAMLAFVLSPLVQLLHAVGMIDHHFMELTFVLLTAWLGLRWFASPVDARYAAGLGLALGVSTAFHNGLFLLQLPVLVATFILWLRSMPVPRRPTYVFAACLITASLLSSLPSSALRSGMFEFALLSWFHVYVAGSSAAAVAFMGWRRFSPANLGWLAGISAVLATPMLADVSSGARFLSGGLSVLDQIGEVASPLQMAFGALGPSQTASFYSWLLFATPFLLIYYAWRVAREREGQHLFYAVFAVFGLSLLLSQYRFHYFGLFTLMTAPLVLLEHAMRRFDRHPGLTALAAFGGVLLLYQPALRERLFNVYPPGDEKYAGGREIIALLEKLCAERPGIVLADHDDGNAVLFHTDCSVIANNFIMRPQDERKIAEVGALLRSSPEAIREHEPAIKYVFLRAADFAVQTEGVQIIDTGNQVARGLLVDERPPAGFKLLHTTERTPVSPEDSSVYARLYEIEGQP
jgi:hypothetical protein